MTKLYPFSPEGAPARKALFPRVQYVSTDGDDAFDGLSWGTAKATVAAALAAVTDRGEIILGAGIAVPADAWERIFASSGPPPLVPPTDGSVSGYTLVQMQKRWDEWNGTRSNH